MLLTLLPSLSLALTTATRCPIDAYSPTARSGRSSIRGLFSLRLMFIVMWTRVVFWGVPLSDASIVSCNKTSDMKCNEMNGVLSAFYLFVFYFLIYYYIYIIILLLILLLLYIYYNIYIICLHLFVYKLGQENLLRIVRWVRWHCPPDIGFEIRALEVWGRARYLTITKAPTILNLCERAEKKHFVSLKLEGQSGARTRDLQALHQGPAQQVTCSSKQHHNEHNMLTQYSCDVVPASQTVDQHHMKIGSMHFVFCIVVRASVRLLLVSPASINIYLTSHTNISQD